MFLQNLPYVRKMLFWSLQSTLVSFAELLYLNVCVPGEKPAIDGVYSRELLYSSQCQSFSCSSPSFVKARLINKFATEWAHQARQHIIQMGRAACWKQPEQVASFIAACQPSGPPGWTVSPYPPSLVDSLAFRSPSWKHWWTSVVV